MQAPDLALPEVVGAGFLALLQGAYGIVNEPLRLPRGVCEDTKGNQRVCALCASAGGARSGTHMGTLKVERNLPLEASPLFAP